MKIGIDVSQVVYGTGVSTYTQNLVLELVKIDKENEYIIFGSSLRNYSKLTRLKEQLKDHPNVSFKFFKLPPIFFEYIWNRLGILPVEKFIGTVDIFHSSDWTQPKIKSKDTKKVTTIHDMTTYLFPTSFPKRIIDNQERRLARAKKEVDAIIAVSKTTKDDIVKFLQINSEKIRVIYSASSSNYSPQDEENIQEVKTKFKIKKPYLLAVSTHEPRKNIQKLIDVYMKIKEHIPDIALVLAGRHGWGETVKEQEDLIITGFVSDEDLRSLYSGCKVFIYPSLYEGFGLPVLEAMACGAPVITSNNSSMAEIAKDAAILVDPRSEGQIIKAIEMVLNLDNEKYQSMKKASINRAKEYSWTETAKETLELYSSLTRPAKLKEQSGITHHSSP